MISSLPSPFTSPKVTEYGLVPVAKAGLSLKGAIAIAQEHAGIGGMTIRGDDIKFTIAVHIAQGHGAWSSSRGEGGLSLKGAIAIAQEHAGGVDVVAKIRGDDIEFTIAVHIAQGHGV